MRNKLYTLFLSKINFNLPFSKVSLIGGSIQKPKYSVRYNIDQVAKHFHPLIQGSISKSVITDCYIRSIGYGE